MMLWSFKSDFWVLRKWLLKYVATNFCGSCDLINIILHIIKTKTHVYCASAKRHLSPDCNDSLIIKIGHLGTEKIAIEWYVFGRSCDLINIIVHIIIFKFMCIAYKNKGILLLIATTLWSSKSVAVGQRKWGFLVPELFMKSSWTGDFVKWELWSHIESEPCQDDARWASSWTAPQPVQLDGSSTRPIGRIGNPSNWTTPQPVQLDGLTT